MNSLSYSLTDESGEYDEDIKLIVIGDSSVGKTNLISRYNGGEFQQITGSTNTASFITKVLEFDNKIYRVNVWDTAGQEKYRSLTKIFLKGSNIALLVYAINDKTTFDSLDYWYGKVREVSEDIIIGIAGNKIDLFEEEQIPEDEALKKAEQFNAKIKFTSALKDNCGIDEIIVNLVKEFINKRNGNNSLPLFRNDKNDSIKLNENDFKPKKSSNKKKAGCC